MSSYRGLSKKKKGQKESTGVLGLCKGKLQKYFSAKKMG